MLARTMIVITQVVLVAVALEVEAATFLAEGEKVVETTTPSTFHGCSNTGGCGNDGGSSPSAGPTTTVEGQIGGFHVAPVKELIASQVAKEGNQVDPVAVLGSLIEETDAPDDETDAPEKHRRKHTDPQDRVHGNAHHGHHGHHKNHRHADAGVETSEQDNGHHHGHHRRDTNHRHADADVESSEQDNVHHHGHRRHQENHRHADADAEISEQDRVQHHGHHRHQKNHKRADTEEAFEQAHGHHHRGHHRHHKNHRHADPDIESFEQTTQHQKKQEQPRIMRAATDGGFDA